SCQPQSRTGASTTCCESGDDLSTCGGQSSWLSITTASFTSFRWRHRYNLLSGVSCVNQQNDYIGVSWLLRGNRSSFLRDLGCSVSLQALSTCAASLRACRTRLATSLRLSSKRKNGCAREGVRGLAGAITVRCWNCARRCGGSSISRRQNNAG